MQNFKAIGATSFELSLDKKLTTYKQTNKQNDNKKINRQTYRQTDTQSYISANDFFNVDHL